MTGWIFAMFAITLLVIIFAVVMLARLKSTRANANADKYDVFELSGNQLTVLAGIPVAYKIDEIERITFSAKRGRRRPSSYSGVMRIVKANGKKSRPFIFDSSVVKRKFVLSSSKQDIEQAIQYLMNELEQYHIRCSYTAG